jgi:hypothetical protein
VSCILKEGVKHEGEKGQLVKSGEGSGQSFVIADESAEASGPSKGALDDPSSQQEDKASFGLLEFDHDKVNSLFGRLPSFFFSGVTLIDKSDLDVFSRRRLHLGQQVAHLCPLLFVRRVRESGVGVAKCQVIGAGFMLRKLRAFSVDQFPLQNRKSCSYRRLQRNLMR